MTNKPKIARPEFPQAPAHLSPEAAGWWGSTVETFNLDEHHLRLLRLACESWDRCQQARAALALNGLTFEDKNGNPRTRPEVAIERDARLAFARLVREIGLDAAGEPEQPRPNPIRGRRR